VDIATDNPWTRFPIDLALSGLRETVFKEVSSLPTIFSSTDFSKVSVDELLFKGYEDPIITPLCRLLKHLCDAYNIPGRIGLFYGVYQFLSLI
jgi:hypothetical protein